MLFPEDIHKVLLDGHHLTLEEVVAVARFHARVSISSGALSAMARSRAVVEELLRENKPVYGINTGFGSLSRISIFGEEASLLQNNLILSHAVGCGQPLPREAVRAIMLLRANALCQGYSGIRPDLVMTLKDMLNAGVHPLVPEKGSLGASGDLAPLAHVALVMLGYGEAEVQGTVMPGLQAMKTAGLGIHSLQAKEGLALINGTQATCAVGALALFDTLQAAQTADAAASFTMEALLGRIDAFDERIHRLRPHAGQQLVARNIRLMCAGSSMMREAESLRVQDAYSIRCIPQVHGAVRDTLAHVRQVLEIEFNSVTDNPLIFPDDKAVISGGNFHGEPLAMALDFLGIAAAELAGISERRLERMVNPQLNEGLPAFLVHYSGVNSGMMILQYTAASMVSENKVLAHPASVDSIPSSANQEDHVSMGMTAARKARLIVENTLSVLALEVLAAAQAIDLRGGEPSRPHQCLLSLIRERTPFLEQDRELRLDVNQMNELVRSGLILKLIAQTVADFC